MTFREYFKAEFGSKLFISQVNEKEVSYDQYLDEYHPDEADEEYDGADEDMVLDQFADVLKR